MNPSPPWVFRPRLRLAAALGAVILGCLTHLAAAPSQQQPPFRSGAKTVAVYATVATRTGGSFRTCPRGLRDPRQWQAAADHRLLQRGPADHRRHDAGPQRQHAGQLSGWSSRRPKSSSAACGRTTRRGSASSPSGSTSSRKRSRAIATRCSAFSGPSSRSAVRRRSGTRSTRHGCVHGQEGRKVVLVFSDGGDAPCTPGAREPQHGGRHAPRGAGRT